MAVGRSKAVQRRPWICMPYVRQSARCGILRCKLKGSPHPPQRHVHHSHHPPWPQNSTLFPTAGSKNLTQRRIIRSGCVILLAASIADQSPQVDTTVEPPRAIWTHPYEDEQYLREHPDIREKVGNPAKQQSLKDSKSARRHSFNGVDSAEMASDDTRALPDSTSKGKGKRGFFGKLKDKAIGTKEERDALKKERHKVRILDVRPVCQFLQFTST